MELTWSHPILSCAAAREWEAALLPDEAAEWEAMRRAGAAIARAVAEDFREFGGLPASGRVLVLAGKGHNGGDALLAARELLARAPELAVDVIALTAESRWRPLARRAWQLLEESAGAQVARIGLSEAAGRSYELCLDGFFGFQLRPPLDEATAGLITAVNRHPRIRVRAAVDLPSGLGEPSAQVICRADFTYATGAVKDPLLNAAAATSAGRIRYLDLGFFAANNPPARRRVVLPSVLAPLAQPRPAQSDKRSYGHLLVVGGSRSYPGAVLMTVQAALRSGTGLVTAFVPDFLAPEYAARFPEAMWVGCPVGPEGALGDGLVAAVAARRSRATAMVIGPGLGAAPETMGAVRELVAQSEVPVVLDADALRPEIFAAGTGRRLIATPHAGEFQRLGGGEDPTEIARRTGAVLVLKGPVTRIVVSGAGEVTMLHALAGGPVLARGGSGDILAGLIAGLAAQAPGDLVLAASRGVVWHGRAADLLARDRGQVAVQTTQLFDYLAPALHGT